MKKLLFMFFCLISVVACQPFDFDVARGDIAKAKIEHEYQTAFAENFGTYGVLNIDPEHNWGFYDIVDTVKVVQTRASIPNANQWLDWGLDVPQPLTDKQKEVVTKWFETHKNPSGIAVSWTDYFAQQVSSTEYGKHMDHLYDASALDENGNITTNNWGNITADHINNYNSGDCSETNITDTWKDKIQYMSGQSTIAFGYKESIGHHTYFDHYVIIPGEEIDPTNEYGLHGMYFVGFDYEAIKNITQDFYCDYCKKTTKTTLTKVKNDDPEYKFVMVCQNCKRENIKATNEKAGEISQCVFNDGYFNDWIIKITPGMLTKPEPVRIMAEDLGAIGDFDFNDVVFDVHLKPSANYGIIILRAAGGTMPLYVGDKEHEVHKLFGVETGTIVNTEGGTGYSVSRPIVQWSFEPTSSNPIDIPIYVDNTRENISYEIGAKLGIAPGKFAVPTTVKWSPECINIKTTWPNFQQWVEDQSKPFWK